MALGYFRIRKIIPPHFKTQPAVTAEEARSRVLWLYRRCLRYSKEIQSIYPLDVPLYQIRSRMRQEFEKNRYLQNLDVINVSLMKGIMELEEMLYMWKTPSHMMKYFKEPQEIKQEFQKIDFLSSFYLNK